MTTNYTDSGLTAQLAIVRERPDNLSAWDDLEALAAEKGVDLRFLTDQVSASPSENGGACITLEDLYSVANFVTFPSLYEGFGNALLEAIYFKKPLLVNRYSVFKDDIEGCGFDLVVMDGAVTDEAVEQVRKILEMPDSFLNSAESNFKIAANYFGYRTLEKRMREMLVQEGR